MHPLAALQAKAKWQHSTITKPSSFLRASDMTTGHNAPHPHSKPDGAPETASHETATQTNSAAEPAESNNAAEPAARASKQQVNAYPPWSPRFWNGMCLGDFWKLCSENGFRISPIRIPMFCLVSCCGVVNSGLTLLQNLTHGRRIREAQIQQPPLFVIGHWRTGTTLLHELISLDEQFAFPSTFDCFAANHFC